MHPFFIKKPPKSFKIDSKMHRFFDWILCVFLFDFGSIREASNYPTFDSFSATLSDTSVFFVVSFFFFGFLGVLAPSWRPLVPTTILSWANLEPCWLLFRSKMGAVPGVLGGFCRIEGKSVFSTKCYENPRIDLSYLLRRNLVKMSLPTLRLRFL